MLPSIKQMSRKFIGNFLSNSAERKNLSHEISHLHKPTVSSFTIWQRGVHTVKEFGQPINI